MVAAALLSVCLWLTGCDRLLEIWSVVDHDHFTLQEKIDAFFQAVDAQDADAIKALFSPNVLREDTDLDETIERLFAFYPGPTEDCYMESSPGSSRHIGPQRMASTHSWFPVISNGVNYYCYISLTYRDDADPDNIGLENLILVSEKVRCSEEFWTNGGWKDCDVGLTVVEDAPGDYLTCRIGDTPYIYTPVDRVLTQEDILTFLETDDRWEHFLERFGEPNAASPYGKVYYYELPDEDGEKRFAYLSTRSAGEGRPEEERKIDTVVLEDGRSSHTLAVLWKNETEDD